MGREKSPDNIHFHLKLASQHLALKPIIDYLVSGEKLLRFQPRQYLLRNLESCYPTLTVAGQRP
jgi:hypothetical protein